MKFLEIFDPAMCCSTGVCGSLVDPALVRFAALLQQLQERGVRPAPQPRPGTSPRLRREPRGPPSCEKGAAALPAIYADGALLLQDHGIPTTQRARNWLIQAGP
ncbi:MAG: arsenic metallochaperone ArsD family protein [Kiritimatiellia bacterium]